MQTVDLEQSKEIDAERLINWIRETYPALDEISSFAGQIESVEAFLDSKSSTAKSDSSETEKLLARMTTATAFGIPYEGAEQLVRAKRELEQVIELARTSNPAAELAKLFLLFVISTGAESLPPNLRNIALEQASDTVLSLSQNADNAGLLQEPLLFTMSNAYSYSPAARRSLFQAFKNITKADGQYTLGLEAACTALSRAIDIELRLPQERADDSLLVEMIEMTIEFPHPEIFPVLTAILNSHDDAHVRAAASKTLYELELSTAKLWQETTPDLVSTEEQRIEKLEEALKEEDPRDSIIFLFKMCKDRALPPPDTPFHKTIGKFLSHESDMVKLAASRVLLQTSFYHAEDSTPDPTLTKTINTLATFAFDTATPHSAREAALLLDSLTNAPDAVRKHIEEAKNRASLEFVNKQTLA